VAKEADLQKLIIDWLTAKRIWHERRNTGAMKGSHKGKGWFVRFGKPGVADIMATRHPIFAEFLHPIVYWIEVKAPKGVQSPEQKAFQAEVEAQGMKYILARSLEDVQKVLEV
jgi:hypothetical protein